MRKPIVIGIAGVLLLATATYSYLSPRLTLMSIASAAKENDSDRLRELIDFPLVRENMKDAMRANMNKRMATDPSLKDNMFAGLGVMLGNMMVDQVVDAIVTPSGIVGAMQAKTPQAAGAAPENNTSLNLLSDGTDGNVMREMRYDSYERFFLKVHDTDKPQEAFTLVLKRSGLFSWRLTEVRLPDMGA
jgi:hypothetical protein